MDFICILKVINLKMGNSKKKYSRTAWAHVTQLTCKTPNTLREDLSLTQIASFPSPGSATGSWGQPDLCLSTWSLYPCGDGDGKHGPSLSLGHPAQTWSTLIDLTWFFHRDLSDNAIMSLQGNAFSQMKKLQQL